MKKLIDCTGFVFLFMLFTSCNKTVSSGNGNTDSTATSFSEVFEKFWNGMNTNYIYWDIDTTNWDAIYYKYKPLFEQLDLNNKTDVQKSVSYFRQMTYGLVDGHFQITFKKPELSGIIIFPAAQHKQSSAGYHYPYNYSGIDVHYFDTGYKSVYDSIIDPGTTPLHVTLATIGNSILYFNCNRFSLLNAYESPVKNEVKSVLDSLFNRLRATPSTIKGVIIDVRNNSGGYLSDLNFLTGHFIDTPLQFGYSCYKSGDGRLDFTPWLSAFITPQPGAKAVKCPIVVLVDNFTVSMAEAVAMAVHALPNGTILGETTWGATGPLIAHEVFNSGQFSIPGFLTVYTSSAKFKYIDGKVYETIGFVPDIPIPFNERVLNAGRDPQLEKAIQQIQ
jgi:carboxyl-terminal processing protease